MIWPWSEFAKQKRLFDHLDRIHDSQTVSLLYYKTEYLKLTAEMRGAHKGIWRLKQKLKKYEKEQP